MFGLLNLNKPAGFSSRDAVNRVQRLVRPVKVGHAGTLDPIATGVLILCLGGATRLIEHVQRMPKRYTGTFLLGRRSPSEDIEIEPELLEDPPVPTREQIEAMLPRFFGTILQTPPAYSAIKIDGRKAYDLARQGKAPQLKPRPVVIHSLEIVRYDYPELQLDLRCGSGTYVRSLGRDLAASLGTAAVMGALVRTEIGPFQVAEGINPKGLTEELLTASLLPASLAVADLPRLEVSAAEVEELHNGRFISREDAPAGDEIAAFGPTGTLVAIVRRRPDGLLQPWRNFR